MKLIYWVLFLSLSISTSSFADRVDVKNYQQFWIWGDIRSGNHLKNAKQVYILQGEIRPTTGQQKHEFQPQGIGVQKLPAPQIWLVIRAYHLDWKQDNLKVILQRIQQWQHAGNRVHGIQIDFDSRTKNLYQYGLFLQDLRKKLPKQYRLSITGLLDWTNLQDAKTLALFRNNIDELVIQTYQGSSTIPNANSYLSKIGPLKLPYKIGLVQDGQWNPSVKFEQDKNFKGYVIFLLRNHPRI